MYTFLLLFVCFRVKITTPCSIATLSKCFSLIRLSVALYWKCDVWMFDLHPTPRPLVYSVSVLLPTAYIIGLIFTLKTHSHIYDIHVGDNSGECLIRKFLGKLLPIALLFKVTCAGGRWNKKKIGYYVDWIAMLTDKGTETLFQCNLQLPHSISVSQQFCTRFSPPPLYWQHLVTSNNRAIGWFTASPPIKIKSCHSWLETMEW